jgi:DNA-binding transcriptional LysR family regulator
MFSEFRLFRDVALHQSLSRAAAANGISQSAASQNIQELERRLGTELLDRSRRPLTLTDSGKLYLEFCRDIVRRAEEFEASLDNLRGAVTGELRIASIYSLALSDMARVRGEFERHCPEVELKVDYLRPDKVYESVLNEAADLGLVSYPESTRHIAVIPWREERMAVALAPSHRLACRRKLKPQDLEGEDFVAFDVDLAIRRNLDRFLKERNVDVHVTMNFDNIQMVKEAVSLGHGISILPDRTMQNELEQGRLKCVGLDAPLVRPVGVVHRKRKKFSPAAGVFLRALPVA